MNTEHSLQSTCVAYFKIKYPNHILFAIPNGGHRNIKTAVRLKAEGVLPGVPDICIPYPNHTKKFPGLYIELKNGSKGKVSAHQQKIISILIENGYKVEIIRTFDAFKSLIRNYLNF